MINIEDYNQGDIYNILEVKDIYYGHDKGALDRVERLNEQPSVFIKTIRDETGIIAVVGGTLLWPGVMEIWSVTGNRVFKQPLNYVKACISLIVVFKKLLGIHRFQASCLSGHKDLEKWFKTLGFVKEGTMRKYGPGGEDFYMYARVS